MAGTVLEEMGGMVLEDRSDMGMMASWNSTDRKLAIPIQFARIDLAQRVSLFAASNIGVFMDGTVGTIAADQLSPNVALCPLIVQ